MSAFRINTPLASTNSLRLFSQSQAKMESAVQRLSSGLRINAAKDDSAGQAISQRMQNQVRGQKMAGANIKQGVNLIRTAEGGLDEIQSILSRMGELVVQSASDNLNTNDRDSINLEYQQLKAEVDRIANSTSYNQMNLLDGSRGGSHGLGGMQNLLATEGFIKRINVANEGAQANNNSEYSSISSDGRYITFESHATNLVDNDTNGTSDIFVHDRQMGTTERVSLASDGAQANHHSYKPSISGDGRYIAFHSGASNLVDNDTNGNYDVFVYDRQTGTTERVSLASDGAQTNHHSYEPSISSNGRYITLNRMLTT